MRELVLHGDLDLLDQIRAAGGHLLEVALEQQDLVRGDAQAGAHGRAVAGLRDGGPQEEPEQGRRDLVLADQARPGQVFDDDGAVLNVGLDRLRQRPHGLLGRRLELRRLDPHRPGVEVGLAALGLLEELLGAHVVALVLRDQGQVVERVRGVGLHAAGALQAVAGLGHAPHLEQDLTLEGAVDRQLALDLQGPAQQEQRPLEILEVEQRFRLQVVDLGFDVALEGAGQQLVGKLERLLRVVELLDQQLEPVQVGRVVVRGDLTGIGEVPQSLLGLTLLPEQLPALVASLGAVGVRPQGLAHPGQGFLEPAAAGGLLGLVQAPLVTILLALRHRTP